MTGSINKKGKSYCIVFRVFDSETGRRRQKWIPGGKTKREAKRKLIEVMGEVHSGAYRNIKKIIFKQFAEELCNSYARLWYPYVFHLNGRRIGDFRDSWSKACQIAKPLGCCFTTSAGRPFGT